MPPPNIRISGIGSIPSGYFLGRFDGGRGDVQLIDPITAAGIIGAVGGGLAGGPGSGLLPIATNRVLANVSGATALPTATALTQPAAGLTIASGASAFVFTLTNDLAALEGLSSTGIAVRTASDTWAQRTITGTAARISVTNGSGVAGNPTLDIDAAYVGQTSITTLGTITTGTWNGAAIPIGTGISGLGAGVATFLATPSSENLAAAVTGETGSGAIVFGTAPTISGAILSTAPTLTGFTAGSVLFAGPSGLLSQDNANLFFDDTNNRLGIRNAAPDVHLDISGNIIRWGLTAFPAQYGFLGGPNTYLIGDAGNTSSDVSLVMRVLGNARWEAGMVGATTDGVVNQSYRIKSITGTYLSEVFSDRFVVADSVNPRYPFVDIYGPPSESAKFRLFGSVAPDSPMFIIGNSDGVSTGSGLEAGYDFNSDISRITSITRGAYYRDLVLEANNLRVSTGPVFLNVDAFIVNSQGAVKVGDPVMLADSANVSNTGQASIALMSGYVPGTDVLTAVGGTGTAPTFTVTATQVSRVNSIAAAGTGGTTSTSTTLSFAAASGETDLLVASITGFANGNTIDVELADGSYHETTINGVPAGGTIVLTDALPSAALVGGDVYKAQTVTGTTGTGTKFIASVVISGGGVVAVPYISNHGIYSVNPPSLTAAPVTGAGLTGTQLNVSMGAQAVVVLAAGSLTDQPRTPVDTTSSAAGVEAVLDIFYANGFGTLNISGPYWADGSEGVTAPAGSLVEVKNGIVIGSIDTIALAKITGLGTGVGTFLATPSSANLATAVTDETGSGALVFGTAPTISGAILSTAPTLTGFTAGSVLFAGTAGLVSQDNANLFWDNSANKLGIGTVVPAEQLDVATTAGGRGIFSDGAGASRKVLLLEGPGTSHSTYGRIQAYNYAAAALNIVLNDLGGNVGIGNTIPAVTLDVGATAAAFRVRNLFTDASNGEWFGVSWAGIIATIGTAANGTGTVRAITAAGAWTFSAAPTLTGFTAGSVLFAGTAGLVSQDNAGLFWDNTNNYLGIGTATPFTTLVAKNAALAGGAPASSGTADASVLVRFEGNLAAMDLGFLTSGTFWIQPRRRDDLSLNFALLFNPNGGNVGIGNTLPAATLDVGATAATFRVRNLFTDASNGEWGGLAWSSNVLNIGTDKNGTGVARNISVNVGGTRKLDYGVTTAGDWRFSANVGITAAGTFYWEGRSLMSSSADGIILLANNAANSFDRLLFGGATTSFPALKRSSAILQARLGDDSAYAAFEANTLRTATAYTVATLPVAGSAGRRSYVTNALAPAYGAAVAPGGAVVCPVFDNGVAWVVG